MVFFQRFKGVKLAWGPCQLFRPVCLYVIAISTAAFAMTLASKNLPMVGLSLIVVILSAAMFLRIHFAAKGLQKQSRITKDAAIQAEEHYISVLRRIVRIVEARDCCTRGHSERVGKLSQQIGGKLGLDAERCEMLNLAGQLHDIGLLAVPDNVLKKLTGFAVADFRAVQRHSELSYELLRPLESLASVLPAIRYHHERLNGTGYPDGLAGEDVPLEARILAVADSYEAMTHDRPYRSAMTSMMAIQELRRCTPSGYDRKCVDALAEIINLPETKEITSPQTSYANVE
jgi:HD-GYP domain-containing protein (c-di-GMP phosphodiesterase class II)